MSISLTSNDTTSRPLGDPAFGIPGGSAGFPGVAAELLPAGGSSVAPPCAPAPFASSLSCQAGMGSPDAWLTASQINKMIHNRKNNVASVTSRTGTIGSTKPRPATNPPATVAAADQT